MAHLNAKHKKGKITFGIPPIFSLELFFFLPCHAVILVPPTEDPTRGPLKWMEVESLNHWTTKEVPSLELLNLVWE